jgi:hypothetical protein
MCTAPGRRSLFKRGNDHRIPRADPSASDHGDYGDRLWRIPFLISAILVVLSGYIRLKLEESPLYARLKEEGKAWTNPIKDG